MIANTSQVYIEKLNFIKALLALLGMLVSLSLMLFIVFSSITVNKSLAFQKDNKIARFEAKIDKLDTLSINFDSFPAEKTAQMAFVSYAQQNKIRLGADSQQSKTVLPVKIYIEDLNKTLKVDNPTSTDIELLNKGLKKAVLRYPGTATLDALNGNTIIFGHSSHLPQDRVFNPMYRAFNDIEKLKKGARIVVIGDDGAKYIYRVSKIWKAKAGEDSIYVKTGQKKLTLVTCDNFGAKEDRWIVEADFVVKL